MGLTEMFRLPLDATRVITYLRLNDRQYLELFGWGEGTPTSGAAAPGYHHVCPEVSDMDDTITTLRSRGLKMFRRHQDGSGLYQTDVGGISPGADGNRQSWLMDPEGNKMEPMQLDRDGMQHQAIARLRA